MTVATIAVGALALVGVLITQYALHRRWAAEQRTLLIEARKASANERKEEMTAMLATVGDQNRLMFDDAFQLIEVHRTNADEARATSAADRAAHEECRREVSALAGQMSELRVRVTESERTHGEAERSIEKHRHIKHQALNALAVSEGSMALVKKLVPSCTCNAFEPVQELISAIKPRLEDILAENKEPSIDPATLAEVAERIQRMEAAADLAAAAGVRTDPEDNAEGI